MRRQRDRFCESAKSGTNSNGILDLCVDSAKTTTPLSKNVSSAEETPKISSMVATQSRLLAPPVSAPTMPVLSQTIPSEIKKKY
jgi:hypothetical protein